MYIKLDFLREGCKGGRLCRSQVVSHDAKTKINSASMSLAELTEDVLAWIFLYQRIEFFGRGHHRLFGLCRAKNRGCPIITVMGPSGLLLRAHSVTMADKNLDIKETNQIRVSLGMQPLPVPNNSGSRAVPKPGQHQSSSEHESDSNDQQGSTLEKRQALAGDNWKKLVAEQDVEQRRKEKGKKLKKKRDAGQRFSKLSGRGLADADEGDDADTLSWLLQSQKRQKKIQKKRARALEKELSERENQAQYTERDLAGARVDHDLEDIEEGEQILTLKDAAVDDEENEDELENMALRENEKRAERIELKKKKPAYDALEAAEKGEAAILGHYDEEIYGKKRKQFRLNSSRGARDIPTVKDQYAEASRPPGVKINLDFVRDDKPISDYQDLSEVKMRRPKKKKENSKRMKKPDDDIFAFNEKSSNTNPDSNLMDIDSGNSVSKKRAFEGTSFIDDDDFQSGLALHRKAALKKHKVTKPDDLARQMREEQIATPLSDEVGNGGPEEGGFVIDETSEFVSNLRKPEAPEPRAPKPKPTIKEEETPAASPLSGPENEIDMDETYKRVHFDNDADSHDNETPEQDRTTTGLDDESTLNEGMGNTLSMLTKRGLLQKPDSGNLNSQFRERQRFLHEKQRREADAEARARAQRERDRRSGKLERMSGKEREAYAQRENQMRDQQDSRQMAEVFNRDYKPTVNLKYVDEFGRDMDQKEAFRFLSHQFHGKGSGKQKTEKKLKRVDEERKKEAQSNLDTSVSTGMDKAARNYRQAGVRLQ